MKKNIIIVICLSLVCLFCISAQEYEDGELVYLNPFEVTSSANQGYLASEVLAGTRVRTSLKDVGSALRAEFIRETASAVLSK